MQLSRRDLFRYAAAGTALAGLGGFAATTATASAQSLGTLIDYSAGVPSAGSIAAAGFAGAIRYVSDRRPGAEWMAGKPMLADEAQALQAAGLAVVSCYQYGKAETADWKGGFEAGVKHGRRGLQLHEEAGGPAHAPIYASIDDNPDAVQFATMIAPYLLGWQSVIGRERVGVYGNSPTIDLAVAAGLGTYYWQHDWGTPEGYVNPHAHLHQFEIDEQSVDGIGIDRNSILKADYGQW
nr:DUF1906 domain-containing protein [Rhodococcus rhodnii]